MDWYFDAGSFSQALKDKRGGQPFRELVTSDDRLLDVSISTLSRLERGSLPDLQTFLVICNWLEISPDRFLLSQNQFPESPPEPATKLDTLELIKFYLRLDKTLDFDQSLALMRVIEAAYKGFMYENQ